MFFVASVMMIWRPSPADLPLAAGLLAPVLLPWIGFLVWRTLHAFRVADRVAARKYENEGRYQLSKEYHDTVFASTTRRRMRLRKLKRK
ncbi:hypothetical protein [Croceibacterium atlanticum]|uniref:hypothetical protein n=1 Tax=Croceibacterium atlanticum TaxID=1267766 RepID=UPI00062C6D25|nr:hypothetical protein [Croceibacterium atlanticum]